MNSHGDFVGDDEFVFYGPKLGYVPPPVHAWLWRQGRTTVLGSLAGGDDLGQSGGVGVINDRDQIVGTSATDASGRVLHAFLWQSGKMTDLGSLGGTKENSVATAVDIHGQVVGWSLTRSRRIHGFLWSNGKMTDLGTLRGELSQAVAINDRGQVVGAWGRDNSYGFNRAFLWQNGKASDLGLVDPGMPIVINKRGQVIRTRHGAFAGWSRGLLWQDGKTTDLGTLGGPQTYPLALNERGQIVGTSSLPDSVEYDPDLRAFLWQGGKMTRLPGGALGSLAPGMAIDPAGTHIVLGGRGQLLLWTYQR